MKGSSTSDAGVSLASTITTAINQRAEIRLVALDIEGAFDHVQWDGLLDHLWSIGFCGRVFHLFESYLSDRYIKVVTPFDSSDLHPISAGVPQGAYGRLYYSISTFDCFLACQDIVQWLVMLMTILL